MPWEMRHTAGGGCRRQVWRRKTSRRAEDASGGGRHIGRRKMRQKAEEASEAEAEFEMERRGGRGFPLQKCFTPLARGHPQTTGGLFKDQGPSTSHTTTGPGPEEEQVYTPIEGKAQTFTTN